MKMTFSLDLRQKVLRCLDKCLFQRRAIHGYVSIHIFKVVIIHGLHYPETYFFPQLISHH